MVYKYKVFGIFFTLHTQCIGVACFSLVFVWDSSTLESRYSLAAKKKISQINTFKVLIKINLEKKRQHFFVRPQLDDFAWCFVILSFINDEKSATNWGTYLIVSLSLQRDHFCFFLEQPGSFLLFLSHHHHRLTLPERLAGSWWLGNIASDKLQEKNKTAIGI